MRKRVLALALALTLLLSVPVSAAWSGLPRTGAAYTGQLSDVTKDSRFYENIAALWEYGLTVGKADGSFGVKDNLTGPPRPTSWPPPCRRRPWPPPTAPWWPSATPRAASSRT